MGRPRPPGPLRRVAENCAPAHSTMTCSAAASRAAPTIGSCAQASSPRRRRPRRRRRRPSLQSCRPRRRQPAAARRRFPIIGPELATYGVVQPLARQLGLSILGTLDDRVGDTYEPDGCAVTPAARALVRRSADQEEHAPTRKSAPAPCPLFSPSVWGRFFGQTIDNRYSAFADPRASGNLGGFQGGIDLLRGPLIPGGYDRAGLYGAYGDVNADVTASSPIRRRRPMSSPTPDR